MDNANTFEDRPLPFFPRLDESFQKEQQQLNRRLYKSTECRILPEKKVLDFGSGHTTER